MTAYHGGKQRIGKEIAEVIYDTTRKIIEKYNFKIKGYCEPFCGMLGVYQHIPKLIGQLNKKIVYKAGDINKSVILMWKAAQRGWKPPTRRLSKREFEKLKYDGKYSAIKGFVGHLYTYRGVFFDGYFKHSSSKIYSSSKNVQNIAKNLKKLKFTSRNYDYFTNLKNYVIYCDPPYKNFNQRYYRGKEYSNRLKFNNDKFWKWCKYMSKNNIVFISEYSAPKRLKKIWEKKKEKLYLMF